MDDLHIENINGEFFVTWKGRKFHVFITEILVTDRPVWGLKNCPGQIEMVIKGEEVKEKHEDKSG